MCVVQVQQSPALARAQRHLHGQVPLGQVLGVGLRVEPSTLPRHPPPQGVPGPWEGPLPLGPNKGASPSLEVQVPNWPRTMGLLKIKQYWISLKRSLWAQQHLVNLGTLVSLPSVPFSRSTGADLPCSSWLVCWSDGQ